MSDENCGEEISLGGSTPGGVIPADDKIDRAADKEPRPDRTDQRLKDLVSNGMSNEALIDTILDLPQDRLIPWEEAIIPSRGLYYDWAADTVKVRAWGASVDKILATSRLAQSGQSIDYILNECCQFPDGFDASQLLVGDQIFLLYYLRGITHGNTYEFVSTCPKPECQESGSYVIDLNELADTIVWADDSLGSEPFKVVLPTISEKVGREMWADLRFMRVCDSQFIIRNRKSEVIGRSGRAKVRKRERMQSQSNRNEHIDLDDTLMRNLETIVMSVCGVRDKFKIKAFVERLQSSDLAIIREWLRDNSPGIDTQVELDCASCGSPFKVMLPITESFFRPQVGRPMRA